MPRRARLGQTRRNAQSVNPRARHRLRLISAVVPRGHRRFGPTRNGGVNGAVLIAFVKQSIAGAKREISSIPDRGFARIAKVTTAFVESRKGKSRLFYLPPYPPDRKPDALAWKHLKVGRSDPRTGGRRG
ncbi:MAG: transposase [Methylocella sp.]